MSLHAVIEDPRGSTRRHAWDPDAGVWREWEHPHARAPWPVSYGFLEDTHNPADGDPLDVMVLATRTLATGTRLAVRVVGLLPRPDGDHKALAVALDDPAYGHLRRLSDVPRNDLAAVERWFAAWSTIDGWEDERAAAAVVVAAGGSPGNS
ncbi:MAG TPA: inorganic diphosphatase [Thermomicrobiaceae bacterium]|nr:inorganic diphosphatase [Thermomicrobiaceae bacterium]